MKLLMCLDIELQICPPRRPDKNPFVERFNGTYKRECILVHCPETLPQAQAYTQVFQNHYNSERPNQAIMLRPCSAQALQQPTTTGGFSPFT
jgi:transposase InsO family protein